MLYQQTYMEVRIYYGRGGWSWYTGSSSWYYRCGIENILGIIINKNVMTLKPCIPDDWDEYFVRYKYNSSVYNIKIKNQYKTNSVKSLKINGTEQKDSNIQLIDNNKIYDVEVII